VWWWYECSTTSVVIVVLVQMLLQKMDLWKLLEQRNVLRLWRSDIHECCRNAMQKSERHPPCFHESPEQRDVALPVKQKSPRSYINKCVKAGYPPYARLIAEWRR
jgi:hypothetical protein